MEQKGFTICDGTFTLEGYVISDLAPRNFVKDNNGSLFCIDPLIR